MSVSVSYFIIPVRYIILSSMYNKLNSTCGASNETTDKMNISIYIAHFNYLKFI